jgi:hypothetical protein
MRNLSLPERRLTTREHGQNKHGLTIAFTIYIDLIIFVPVKAEHQKFPPKETP